MSWNAPDLSVLAEQSVARARIELSCDPRVAGAAPGEMLEPLPFVAELIEERLRASYITGLEAAEASYRASASEYLHAQGMPMDTVRAQVRESGERLLAGVPSYPLSLPRSPWPAPRLAGITLGIWVVAIVIASLFFSWWATVYTVLALVLGALDALLVYAWRSRAESLTRQNLIDELPVSVCRHYLDDYRKRAVRYEAEIDAATR